MDEMTLSEHEHVDSIERRLLRLERAYAFAADTASAERDLPTVLQAIVDSSRNLLGARYAALGVIGHDGRLEEFVHSGMDDETVEKIGALPRGKGILGLLIDVPVPLRLSDLGSHEMAVGFPSGHPPMGAFLGVPIQVGGEVFGNLYLTEPVNDDEFTSEDEVVATMMAGTAGGVIANAQLMAESELRRRWLAATNHLSYGLLTDTSSPPMELIAHQATIAADADIVTITVPEDDDTNVLLAASGPLASRVSGSRWPIGGTATEQVMQSGEPTLIDHYDATDAAENMAIGPLMVVPLAAGEHPLGVMSFARSVERRAFGPPELGMAAAFAHQAALAMELVNSRKSELRLAVLEDNERIAEDLHDHVIQELLATGMSLQGIVGRIEELAVAQRLTSVVESLDGVISRIRATIFDLQLRPAGPGSSGLRASLIAVIDDHVPQLGFRPQLEFSGVLDTSIDAGLSDDILAATREALSNCARHARASSATISAILVGQLFTLSVTDNGVGIGQPERSSGLANMQRRANRHQGMFSCISPEGGGTQFTWTARLSP